jgi:DNA-binding MarR family transcriptional regulator
MYLPMQTLPQHEHVGLLIGAARRSIKQAVGRRLGPLRLSPQQFWVLVALREAAGISLCELAQRQRVDAPTASRIVAALVRRGLVRTCGDPGDRRRRCLQLTAKGTALAERIHPIAGEVRQAVCDGFSAEELDSLRGLLRRVVKNMDRFEEPGPGAARRGARA